MYCNWFGCVVVLFFVLFLSVACCWNDTILPWWCGSEDLHLRREQEDVCWGAGGAVGWTGRSRVGADCVRIGVTFWSMMANLTCCLNCSWVLLRDLLSFQFSTGCVQTVGRHVEQLECSEGKQQQSNTIIMINRRVVPVPNIWWWLLNSSKNRTCSTGLIGWWGSTYVSPV